MAAVWEGLCLLILIMSIIAIFKYIFDASSKTTIWYESFSSLFCSGHVECVSILLKAGADKKGTAPDGTSLIDAAEKQEIRDLLA